MPGTYTCSLNISKDWLINIISTYYEYSRMLHLDAIPVYNAEEYSAEIICS